MSVHPPVTEDLRGLPGGSGPPRAQPRRPNAAAVVNDSRVLGAAAHHRLARLEPHGEHAALSND
jgi:pyrimidine deaminase RibD-like protein